MMDNIIVFKIRNLFLETVIRFVEFRYWIIFIIMRHNLTEIKY